MTPRSVAVQGLGFGALAIATMGLLGGATAQPEIGLERFADAAATYREADASEQTRCVESLAEDRSAMAQDTERSVEVLPVFGGIDVSDSPDRAVSVTTETREVEIVDV
jgi:hypothetical protein